MANVLAPNSTNVVELTSLEDTVTHVLPTNAVVVCTLTDSLGANVAGATGLPMPYEAATAKAPAGYRCRIASTVVLTPGQYIATITVTAGSRVRVFTIKCTVSS